MDNAVRPALRPALIGASAYRACASGIRSLFAAGEPGVWYDPSDAATLFQDVAGLIPATEDGQPVALMLDKSGHDNNATQETPELCPILRIVGGLSYLQFNGTDSFLVTGAIDLTATTALTVFAGITKDSDAASAILCETNGGGSRSFSMFAPSGASPSFGFRIWGGLGVTVHAMGYAAPVTAVLTGYGDTPSGLTYLRVNGAAPAVSDPYPNGGGMGNGPMFIGRRNGTSSPFTGDLYGLIVRGAYTSPKMLEDTELYMAEKTGVVLP